MTPSTRTFPLVSLLLAILVAAALLPARAFGQTTLLHYWSFNQITTKATIPAPAIKASYSYLDTNKAVLQYDTIPGTPKSFVDSINTNSKSNGAYDNVTGDTTNARMSFAAGNALRLRNPSWSAELRIYMPTTLYNNPIVKYALQSSSTTSGQHYQVFAYSTDSGATWKTSSLTVNGVATDTLDCTQSQYQSSTTYGLVTLGFGGDTTVNSDPRLVLRIRWVGQAATFSGNNRIDNLSVEAGPVPRTISITAPALGDTLISGVKQAVTFTTTGKISRKTWIYYSLDSGRSWTAAGTDTTNTFVWTVPKVADPVANAMIAVVDSAQIEGVSARFVILPVPYYPPDANLIYYWHFNGFSGAYTSLSPMAPDYTAIPGASASIAAPATSKSQGLIDGAVGTSLNTQMKYLKGNALEIDNPSNSDELRLNIPTTNRKNISVTFALQTSDGIKGPLVASYDFSLDSGATWQTTGMPHTYDSINGAGYTNGNWGLISVPLKDSLASDNPKLVFRIRFSGNNSSANGGYVRIDNVTVTGPVGQVVIAGAPTLLHYWSFNNILTAYHNPGIPSLPADFSLVDTGHLDYTLEPGTSANYLGYLDGVAGDTLNSQLAAPAGNALRVRNPSDSMELRIAIPTTGYKDIVIHYALESSSTNSGQLTELFDYSPDGGTTWKTSGLTVQGQSVDTLDVTDSIFQGTNWGLVTVALTDPSASNNRNLIFRIRFSGNTSKTSGNNRLDNLSVIGTPGVATPTSPVIHYWHFDSLNTAYHNPGIPPLLPDYSALSNTTARIQYVLDPGTSSTYAGYVDNVTGDTTNAQFGDGAGNALRVRNPSDSMSLQFVIPTTGYQNISMTYALESSSTTSGQLEELFDYSTDGGTTWQSSSLTVNGANVDTLDVTQPQFQGANWGLVTIGFGSDASVDNNPNLILRIRFAGNTSKTSGNNRIENVTVDGTPIGQQENVTASLSVTAPEKSDTLYAGTQATIRYSVSGPVTAARTLEYSTNGGSTWVAIATGVTATSYSWAVPAITSFSVRVRVRDANGAVGIGPVFAIITPGSVSTVELSASALTVSQAANIIWHASGYLGSTVNIDVSYDQKQTWNSIVQNYNYGANSWYTWTPQTMDTMGAIIRVTFAEGAVGYSAPFKIYPLEPAGVNEQAASTAASAWPDPANRSISLSNPMGGNCSISVFDAAGRDVLDLPNESGRTLTLDISKLIPGAYHVAIVSGEHRWNGQFVVQH